MTRRENHKDELLRIATGVVAGERDPTDLEKYDIDLGNPITGDAAKQMLLAELAEADETGDMRAEQIGLAREYWAKLAAEGLQEGTKARVEVLFSADDEHAAQLITKEFDGDGWKAVGSNPADDACRRVRVVTPPLVMGREVFEELASQMVGVAQEFGCSFLGIDRVAPEPTRPWWRFW